MDYYQMRNIQSDTQMRNAIAGAGNNTPGGTDRNSN
jgi:uncharacterized protein YqfA (UPF0365 family)